MADGNRPMGQSIFCFILLRFQVEEGVWEWVDGAKLNYTNWNTGEPNNWWGSENCAAVNYATFPW